MPFPDNGTVSVLGGSEELKPAHLIKLPEHVWQQMEQAAWSGERVKISLDGGEAAIVLPNSDRIILQAHTTGTPTEIHILDSSSSSLQPVAQANARLSVPISASTSAKAAEKVRAQTEARDKEKKANADRINGVAPPRPVASVAAATSMSRTQSSPVNGASGSSSSLTPSTPVVPLKTRVVQLLALGPCVQSDMVRKLGGAEADIMRVVNVVGRKTSSSTPTYELQPAQYAKIKIGEWTYSSSERQKVITLARKAFDELKLPSDADERVELDRKEAAALRSKSSSPTSSIGTSSRSAAPAPAPRIHPLPSKPVSVAPSAATSRNISPAPRPSSPAPPTAKQKLVNGKKEAEQRSPASKKENKEKSMFSKQLNKFRAEKRAASLPNGKAESGVASPRLPSSPVQSSSKQPAPSTRKDRSTSAEKEKVRKPTAKRRTSRDYSSSEEDSDAERAPPAKAKKESDGGRSSTQPKKRPSPDYSSSTDEDRPRGRSAKRPSPPSTKPKPPDKTPTKLNGHASTSAASQRDSTPSRSAEDMRERYEELFPAYQQLTKKLVGVYQDCEDVEEEGKLSMTKEEVAKMAQRWQKWHKELEGIRQWFDNGNT